MSRLLRFVLPFAVGLTACTVHVFSPPSGLPTLETSAAMGASKQAIGGDAFVGAYGLGPTLSNLRASYRRGVDEKLDWSIAPAFTWIYGAERGESHAGIYSARGALKYALNPHFAFALGLGAGYSAGGAFAAPDLGVTASYDNPYLVPFASLRGFLSVPFARQGVHIYDTDDEGDEYLASLKPEFTYGHQFALGLRLKLRNARDAVYPSLACALAFTGMWDGSHSDGVFGATCGFDVTF